jgi:hypothetical protein
VVDPLIKIAILFSAVQEEPGGSELLCEGRQTLLQRSRSWVKHQQLKSLQFHKKYQCFFNKKHKMTKKSGITKETKQKVEEKKQKQ